MASMEGLSTDQAYHSVFWYNCVICTPCTCWAKLSKKLFRRKDKDNVQEDHSLIMFNEPTLILKDVHIQTHLWKLKDSGRTICILLEKDKKTPFTNLRAKLKICWFTSIAKTGSAISKSLCTKSTCRENCGDLFFSWFLGSECGLIVSFFLHITTRQKKKKREKHNKKRNLQNRCLS